MPRARYGAPVARHESDPSLMLGLVLLVVVGAFVAAAAAGVIAWIVTQS
ncbi:MAG: hypothetical protein M5U27_01160 [Gaiella sp.]|nr:hypothetical protein [Gaiella sp.]